MFLTLKFSNEEADSIYLRKDYVDCLPSVIERL